MSHKKGRGVRKIEVPKDTPTVFELGDTAADIQRRREERDQREREREEEALKQREERLREEAMRVEPTHSAEEGVAGKRARTARSDTEMDTEGGGVVGTSQPHSRHKKGHMTNIYLNDSDEEALCEGP